MKTKIDSHGHTVKMSIINNGFSTWVAYNALFGWRYWVRKFEVFKTYKNCFWLVDIFSIFSFANREEVIYLF